MHGSLLERNDGTKLIGYNKSKLAETKEGMHLSTLATEMASGAFPGLEEYQEPESPYNNGVELLEEKMNQQSTHFISCSNCDNLARSCDSAGDDLGCRYRPAIGSAERES